MDANNGLIFGHRAMTGSVAWSLPGSRRGSIRQICAFSEDCEEAGKVGTGKLRLESQTPEQQPVAMQSDDSELDAHFD